MHLAPLIKDLAIILAVAGFMTFLFRKIRQPVVLGYILAGLIIGPYTPPFQMVTDMPSIQTWAELGVIFLMFTLGLEFSFRKLAQVGFSAFMAATAEVLFFLFTGYGIGIWIGWTPMESIYLGAMLSVSSTTIIIKALDELNLKNHKFAHLIFGILIVEDLLAILMLVGLTTISKEASLSFTTLSFSALKLIFVVGSWFIIGYFAVPKMMKQAGKVSNPEMITIISLGLCLLLVVFASYFEYSTALGAFIMGSILAETSLLHQIEERLAPIRDLFGAIFFVSIGMLIDPKILMDNAGLILILSAVTIVGKIISTGSGSLASGQSVKTSLQVGMGLAQIGEFSFIIASLGLALKAVGPQVYPIAVAVSLVTTFTTPYLIKYSLPFSAKVESWLPQRFTVLLHRYDLWIEHIKTQMLKREYLGKIIFRWVINGMMVTLIFLVSRHFAGLLLEGTYRLPVFLFAMAASLPFIWAMLFGHRKFIPAHHNDVRKNWSFMISPLLTLAWIMALCALFFPLRFVLPISAISISLLIGLSYRKLESSYHWFENSFLSSFVSDEKKKEDWFNHLAPWNVHLVNLKVHPNSLHVQKKLHEANLRSRIGINVVAITRGVKRIVSPGPNQIILPSDELVVLGTDEQVDQLKKELEYNDTASSEHTGQGQYQLRLVNLDDVPQLAGITIRQSGIRESYHALIVGIERDGKRIINPDTDSQLLMGDKLWLVGDKNDIDSFLQKSAD